MRIISGTLRGKSIVPPVRLQVRPTTDFAKENLFNILANRFDFESVRVLDLFAGTGSISYEFASRGCVHVDCVEMNPLHHAFIRQTAQQLELTQIHAVRHNVFDFLAICTAQYDIIFADPPFELKGIKAIPNTIFQRHLLLKNGVFILEHAHKYDFGNHPHFKQRRDYGSLCFSFFE